MFYEAIVAGNTHNNSLNNWRNHSNKFVVRPKGEICIAKAKPLNNTYNFLNHSSYYWSNMDNLYYLIQHQTFCVGGALEYSTDNISYITRKAFHVFNT